MQLQTPTLNCDVLFFSAPRLPIPLPLPAHLYPQTLSTLVLLSHQTNRGKIGLRMLTLFSKTFAILKSAPGRGSVSRRLDGQRDTHKGMTVPKLDVMLRTLDFPHSHGEPLQI